MIETRRRGYILTIILNAPERHNALSVEDMETLHSALNAAGDARAIVITGTGRSFCAGVSLGEVSGKDMNANPLGALCDRLSRQPQPVICALNGGVYGGGVELALACDFRIGAEGMKMFVPPARLGIHYQPVGMSRVIAQLGLQMARRIFLKAETFTDEALLDIGFLDALVPAEALEDRAFEEAEALATLAPMAVQGMKITLNEIAENRLDADAARGRIAAAFASSDHAEGLAAQKEKRPPKFIGR
ncbi:enoyl-CoA hydratase/isomerase family protein [Paracoccaceae bacterium GXU_MW_L88]